MLKLVAVFCGHFDLMTISVVLHRFHRKPVLSLFCISMRFVYVTHHCISHGDSQLQNVLNKLIITSVFVCEYSFGFFVNSQNEMSGQREPSLTSTTPCPTVCAAFFANLQILGLELESLPCILLPSHSTIAVNHCGEFKSKLNLNSWIINLLCKITFQHRKACFLKKKYIA